MTTPDLGKTYLGSVDDVAVRAGWYGQFDLDAVLCERVLLGGPVLINDGYFVMHPDLRKRLLHADVNDPFRVLAEEGFVRVLKRDPSTDSLRTLIPKMAKKGISTFAGLGPEEAKAIDERLSKVWDRVFTRSQGYVDWPRRNISHACYRLLEHDLMSDDVIGLMGVSCADMGYIRRIRDELFDPRRKDDIMQRPRSELETLVDRYYREGMRSAVRYQLKSLAAEVYHYAWAACLANDDSGAVYLDTQESMTHQALAPPVELPADRLQKTTVLRIPRGLRLDPATIRDIVREDGRLHALKMAYLRQLEAWLQGGGDHRALEEAATAYARAIAELTRNEAWIECAINVLSVSAIIGVFTLGGPPAAVAGAAALTAWNVAEKAIKLVYSVVEPVWLPRFAHPLAIRWEARRILSKVTPMELPRHIHVARVSRSAAIELVKDVPEAVP